MMRDIQQIISDLEQQKTAIERALLALRGMAATSAAASAAPGTNSRARTKKHRLSEEGRRRIAEAARKRWAAQRSQANRVATAKKTRRKRSAAKKASE